MRSRKIFLHCSLFCRNEHGKTGDNRIQEKEEQMQGKNRGWRSSVCGVVGVLAALLVLSAPASALTITSATQVDGVVRVSGSQAAKAGALIRWEGAGVTYASSGGFFVFSSANVPPDCIGSVSDGVSTVL